MDTVSIIRANLMKSSKPFPVSFMKSNFALLLSVIFLCLCSSCLEEEDFGFPSGIEMSAKGESIDIDGTSELPPSVGQMELLDYEGDGNNSSLIVGDEECIEVSTDWLTVRYSERDYKLTFIAEPNMTGKKRRLYLYLYSGYSWQEIKVVQSGR